MNLRLEENCEFVNGGSWTANEYDNAGYPVLKVSNFDKDGISYSDLSYLQISSFEKYKRNQLEIYDIVIATVGSHPSLINSAAGRCISVPKDAAGLLLNQNAVCVRTKDSKVINQRYLGYLCKSQIFQHFIQQRGKGAANQMRIPISGIKDFEFDFPSIQTQCKIASILSAYDDLIENNLKRIKLLEEKAQLTYEEWFVKMRFPGYETAAFDEMTGLPEGWEKKEFQYFGKVITGKTPSTKNELFFDGKIPFVKTPDMAGFPYVLDCSQQLSKLGGNSQQNKFIPKNSLMISCIGSAGAFALASEDCQTNQQINSIIFYQEYYTFYFYCLAKGLKPILEGLGSNGATMTNVNKGKFEKIEAIFPELQLLKYYHDIVKNHFEIILSLQKQNRLLKEARDILLPRLMSGMVDVEELQLETLQTT